jgi:hypothetical protein
LLAMLLHTGGYLVQQTRLSVVAFFLGIYAHRRNDGRPLLDGGGDLPVFVVCVLRSAGCRAAPRLFRFPCA